jgi:sulfite exporter TauE/SafE
MPCGLLYSALMVAALSASAVQGGLIMLAFGAGTAITLTVAPWLLLRLRGGASGAWGIRLAGLALVLTSGWALWMGITQPSGLWC